MINQFKQDIEALSEVVSHLIHRLKDEVKNNATPPAGQKPLCNDKQDIIATTMKLTNMLARIFSLKHKLEGGDKKSFDQIKNSIAATKVALGQV
ncbi:MAG: hypothetical protein K0R98_882 [Rickettsiaceae bacterium]|nr:hypothetical protein [Rickettsiaceae bacterium]